MDWDSSYRRAIATEERARAWAFNSPNIYNHLQEEHFNDTKD